MEQAVCFLNESGKKLFGIAHIPDNATSDDKRIGVNLLNPGIKYRVAPHHLNVKLARELCNRGYFVFRFDPEGIGDSEGELTENTHVADLWGQIQNGLFIKDTIAANTCFIEKYYLDKLVLIGSCGGAITALLAATQDPRIENLCLIDIPVFQWDSKKRTLDIIVGGQQTDRLFLEYVKMIFQPQYWFKLITLNVDFRTFTKVFEVKLKNFFFRRKDAEILRTIEDLCRENKLNREFFQAVRFLISNKKSILFITAGNDPGRETFESYFQNGYLPHLRKSCNTKVAFHLIENANHSYSLSESQYELFDNIIRWLAHNCNTTMSR